VLTFERLPYLVSQGAQKCFMHFADRIGKEWENRADSFNEGYFKDAIAMGDHLPMGRSDDCQI